MLVPKLRFKREDGSEYLEWDSKSFANAFAPLNNNTFSRDMLSENGTVLNIHYGDILVKFGEVCDIQTADIPKVNADIDISKYDELQDGDIILADTAEDETVGKAIEIYQTGTSKVVSGLHTMACRPNDKYAAKYLGYYINSPTYHNQLLPFMQGIKVTSIGRKNIADTVIYYPSDLEEQQKIADFLSTVDEVIAQSEAEVANLEQQKKAAMQKIFSQEVRFKREDGTEYPEWEMDSLKNLCDYTDYRGKTPTKTESGIFLITAKNIKQGYIDYDTSKEYIAESDYDNVMHRGLPQIGDVLITTEAPCGNIAQIDRENVALAQRVIKYRGRKEIISNNYLCFALQSDYFQDELDKKATGGTVKGIKGSVLHTLSIFVPCLEEQQKIADFLSAYDEAISYTKQELEHWKQLKKGLLQQMFV